MSQDPGFETDLRDMIERGQVLRMTIAVIFHLIFHLISSYCLRAGGRLGERLGERLGFQGWKRGRGSFRSTGRPRWRRSRRAHDPVGRKHRTDRPRHQPQLLRPGRLRRRQIRRPPDARPVLDERRAGAVTGPTNCRNPPSREQLSSVPDFPAVPVRPFFCHHIFLSASRSDAFFWAGISERQERPNVGEKRSERADRKTG